MASYTTRFEIRKDKLNKKGEVPISLLVSVSNQRKRIKTGITIPPAQWDPKNQTAVYLTKKERDSKWPHLKSSALLLKNDIADINEGLEQIKIRMRNIVRRLELDQVQYDAQLLADQYEANISPSIKKGEPANFLFDFIDNYIKTHEPVTAKNSMSVYKSLRNYLSEFQAQTGVKVRFDSIDYDFFLKFQGFLIEHKTFKKNTQEYHSTLNSVTIGKRLENLKTFIGYAKMSGVKVKDSYRDFKIKKQKLEVIALSEDEYMALKKLDLNNCPRLDKARDIFIFMCATSMRYSDYNQFRREHIKGNEIKLTIKKTRKEWSIPLNQDSHQILEKYKNLHKPLPTLSNVNLSKYVREVAEMAGIDDSIEIIRYKGAEPIRTVYPKFKLISAHTGRKTFCTLSLRRGVPAETVMLWSGHNSYSNFKRYIYISETHKMKEMERAWGAVPNVNKNQSEDNKK